MQGLRKKGFGAAGIELSREFVEVSDAMSDE
jgi:hypothetical protein